MTYDSIIRTLLPQIRLIRNIDLWIRASQYRSAFAGRRLGFAVLKPVSRGRVLSFLPWYGCFCGAEQRWEEVEELHGYA